MKLLRNRLELGQVNVDNIAVNEHLPGVAAEIGRAHLLLHFFLNKRLFLWRNPDDKLLGSGSVLQYFQLLVVVVVLVLVFETGLGSAQQAQNGKRLSFCCACSP